VGASARGIPGARPGRGGGGAYNGGVVARPGPGAGNGGGGNGGGGNDGGNGGGNGYNGGGYWRGRGGWYGYPYYGWGYGFYDPFWPYPYYYPYSGFGLSYSYSPRDYYYPAEPVLPPEDYLDVPPDGGNQLGQVWYYCEDPAGYYPYVRSCNGAWQEVPATPPGAAPEGDTPPDTAQAPQPGN
jgi:hypothetical protein